MTVNFNIGYAATYGEEVVLLNVLINDGEDVKRAAIDMTTNDGTLWTCRLKGISSREKQHIDYFFSVSRAGRDDRREWTGITHRIDLNLARGENISIHNIWHSVPSDAELYTTAYTKCLRQRDKPVLARTTYSRTLRLIVRAPNMRHGERLAVAGKGAALGDWDPSKALGMTEHNIGEWQVDMNAANVEGNMEFKFVAISENGDAMWENGDNRHLDTDRMQAGDVSVHELRQAMFDTHERKLTSMDMSFAHIDGNGKWNIGDFGDLNAAIDHIADNGCADMIKIAPVNDTISTGTSADATPYSIISAYALHPIYADLRQLGDNGSQPADRYHSTMARRTSTLPHEAYESTLKAKLDALHRTFCAKGDNVMHSAAFKRFFAANETWLVPYAQYCYLRDAYAIADFRLWPNHNEWTEAERGQLQNPRTKAYKKLAFLYYVQYVLHVQLATAHEHARDCGIVLAGDLTANINPNGCDVWQEPDLVDTDEWWRQRLKAMNRYYDACRVTENVKSRRGIAESTQMLLVC